MPLLSVFSCAVEVFKGDANRLAPDLRNLDLAYLDPPYNQHPYGSNYFMLNLIVSYKKPDIFSAVSGIPGGWNRSAYNKRQEAARTFADLAEKTRARFLLVSFNSEGFIPPDEMKTILEKTGKVEIFDTKYNAFRGSRNLRERQTHVREYFFLVEK